MEREATPHSNSRASTSQARNSKTRASDVSANTKALIAQLYKKYVSQDIGVSEPKESSIEDVTRHLADFSVSGTSSFQHSEVSNVILFGGNFTAIEWESQNTIGDSFIPARS
jgi:hypothetical protein